ncbi:hypothetical protein ACJMK2_010902 [Sinanodonta woodiana]|uniref:Tyrosinase copper-binding domain-containing protein n=1 Tax=Sinanodonta woodiana TaxID=1069815 RepID=A0ABD3VIF5_SINWO
MNQIVCVAILAIGSLLMVNALLEEMPMPVELDSCLQSFKSKNNITNIVGEKLFTFCLNGFLWKTERIRWSGYNVTQADLDYFNSLVDRLLYFRTQENTRTKRQARPGGRPVPFPPTGPRIRREYRRLPDPERALFHRLINELKVRGIYDLFANLHQGIVINSAHMGPSFLAWHRVYITLFEEALRQLSPQVSLPYWDSTLDFDMADPSESIIWSSAFLGNGDGVVVRGPFAGWSTPIGQLMRNTRAESRLISKDDINNVLSQCRHADILMPTAQAENDIEMIHGTPHNWVGGQMSMLNTAAHDPVFFLHHAFIDHIWWLFRTRQRQICGINPATDYPQITTGGDLHHPLRPMDGMSRFLNIDGFQDYWENLWFTYEPSPTCSPQFPDCGSPYLFCAGTRCISRTRDVIGEFVPRGMDGEMNARRAMGEVQNMPPVGPKFIALGSDGRSMSDTMGRTGMLTDVGGSGRRGQRGPVGRRKRSGENQPTSDQTTQQPLNPNPSSTPQVVSKAELFPGNSLNKPIQNTFFVNGVADVKEWVFVPVQVIHIKPKDDKFSVYPVVSGKADFNQDFYSISSPALDARIKQGHPKEFSDCKADPSGAAQVVLQAVGINYMGRYSEFAIIDSRLPIASSMVYIGVKNPANGISQAIISAHDHCGRVCQPQCIVRGSNPPVYKPCSGAIRLSSASPKMYGDTIGDAIMDIWHWSGNNPKNSIDDIQMVMVCKKEDLWPWN